MFRTQAIYSDSDNESNYGELVNSEYEDDILFDQNVDLSVETFSVNIGGNTRINNDSEKFISKELQKKMQNEDDNSDCVVSSDMERLNSDSDAKHNPKTDEANPKLALGQIFQNKKEFKKADTAHEIKRGRIVQRYRQIERAVLSGEIIGLNLRGAAVTREGFQEVDLSETVRMMEESIPQVILLLEAAVKRCINFTSGFEVDELILVLNDVTLQYISTLQENVEYKTLSLIVSRSSIDQNKPDIVKGNGTGQLLVARKVALEVSALRLVDIPEKARKLLNLLEDSKDSSNDETNIGEVSKAMGEGDFVRDSELFG
ncbi:hypothetical protein FXO37_08858 [Capsicum annuum]|nr:hypothetical protein FXO37_08858 [Capsicum annuum]